MRSTGSRWRGLAVGVALAASVAQGDIQPTAKAPLAPPLFSFDLASPSVGPGLLASDVLRTPGPAIEVPAPNLGLFFANADELDALSFSNSTFTASTTFLITFSVDRLSAGLADPDPALVADGFPFNMKEQAAKGQAAGDQFMSLTLFNKDGPTDGGDANPNNTQPRNQGDAGGVDFSADPNVSPAATTGDPLDEVDAGATEWGGADLTTPIFFSLANNSPSLLGTPFLPPGDGATIYVDMLPNQQFGQNVYVQGFQLGLQPGDDIAALIVFDDGDLKFENGVDQVIFTLSRDSPSLAGPLGPADLLTSKGNGIFELYASAQLLGLLATDHVDMLDLAPCNNVQECVNLWAIGYFDIGGFEPPRYKGSMSGAPTAGQEGWYVPAVGGDPHHVYTYASNALGVPRNPLGGAQFDGAKSDFSTTGANPRAEHHQGFTAGDEYQLRFDFYGRSTVAPATNVLGGVSLQPSTKAMFIDVLASFPNVNEPSVFQIGILGEDASGAPTPQPGVLPGPPWTALTPGDWYRVCVCFNFKTRRVSRACIRNLTLGTPSACSELSDLYIAGSLAGLPYPTGLRLLVGGDDNIAAFDNVSVASGPCGCPTCPPDLDGDGFVGQGDLGILLAAFGKCPGDPGYSFVAGSLAGDLCVTQGDLGVLLSFYGSPCP